MSDLEATCFYEPAGEHSFTATSATAGPWSPDLQHGGPPAALAVWAAERAAAQALGKGHGMVALRAAVDFLSAVPVAPVSVSAEVVKPGRTAALVDATLLVAGRAVLRARVGLVRLTDLGPALGGSALGAPDAAPTPPPEALTDTEMPWSFPFGRHMQWRAVSGGRGAPGAANVWLRQRVPLVAGEEPTALQRAVTAADSGSGISAVLPMDRWSFVNVDLDVHLLRPITGPWVGMDALTRLAATGSGHCATDLRDVAGWVGTSAQTLVVERRTPVARPDGACRCDLVGRTTGR